MKCDCSEEARGPPSKHEIKSGKVAKSPTCRHDVSDRRLHLQCWSEWPGSGLRFSELAALDAILTHDTRPPNLKTVSLTPKSPNHSRLRFTRRAVTWQLEFSNPMPSLLW